MSSFVNMVCHGSNIREETKEIIPSKNVTKNSKILVKSDEDENLGFEIKKGLIFTLSAGNDFQNFRQKNCLFIDKSLFIRDVIENVSGSDVLLITRPRRWGKSLNLSMLKYFFAIVVDENGKKLDQNPNKYLFNNLKILQEKTTIRDIIKNIGNEVNIYEYFQGKYPVLLLSFKDAKGDSFLDIKKAIGEQIFKVYKEHDYLIKSKILNETEKKDFIKRFNEYKRLSEPLVEKSLLENITLSNSLEFLTKLLYQHHKEKSYLLIDEYDYPVNTLLAKHAKIFIDEENKNEKSIKRVKDTMNLISSIISPCSKTSAIYAPEKVILVGINDILVKEGSSGVNNIKTIGINDYALNEYFGICKQEIEEQFLDKMFVSTSPKLKNELMSIVALWYNGYYNPSSKHKIYNVWSVANYLSDFYNNSKIQGRPPQKMQEEGLHRLSLVEGRYQPKGYWLKTGDSDILEGVINLNIDEGLLNKLKTLSDGKPIHLSFDQNINLYTYFKNKEGYDSEQAISSLLINSGYLTQSDKKGTYRIPNNEVKEHFDKHVSQAWLAKLLKVSSHAASKFSKELSENLTYHDEFANILQSKLLSKVSPGDKPEAYFEMLIGGIIENYYLWNKENAKFYTIPQKTVSHGRIDNIFLPNQESGNKSESIIHEYKKLDKTMKNNVEKQVMMLYGKFILRII
jgi:hypothetical protein